MRPIFDGHNDALTRADHAALAAGRPGGHVDLPRMRAGGMRGGIFAVFSPSPDEQRQAVAPTDEVIQVPYASPLDHAAAAAHATAAAGRLLTLEQTGEMRMARTIADVDAAFAEPDGPPVAVLHLEGAEALDPRLEALDLWYAAGLRSLGPVWSRPNAFAHGVPFVSPSSPDIGPGLTEEGRALVARCAARGILVDLSHLNEAGFWDVAQMDVGPLVASHSGAHALVPASRNLTDAQLAAVGSSDGLVGVVFACPFIRPDFQDEPDAPLSLIVDHVRYVADRIGVDHVGLGSDFDGATIPSELGDVAGLPRLLDALVSAGFSSDEVERIAWRNWRRVLDAWWR